MAHHVYTTPGFIVDSEPRGEANKLYSVFTRDLGMIRATAQGVRLSKSKLKPALQDLCLVRISVVRGKDMWRITSAASEKNYFLEYKNYPDVVHALSQVFVLLKRLMPGEQKDELLFSVLIDAFVYLQKELEKETEKEGNVLSKEELQAFERILVIRILRELGYMAEIKALEGFVKDLWSRELLNQMIIHKKQALQEINTSIRETQL